MANILLVVSNIASPVAGDVALKSILEGDGHTVTNIDDGTAEASASSYDLAVLGDARPAALGSKYSTWTKPVLYTRQDVGSDNTNGHAMIQSGSASTEGTDSVTINFGQHPAANGNAAGSLTILTLSGTLVGAVAKSNLGAGAVVIAYSGATTEPENFVYEAGAALYGGARSPNRRGFFGIGGNHISKLSSGVGIPLFLAMVDWCLDGVASTSTAASGGSATSVTTNFPSQAADYYKRWLCFVTSGTYSGESFEVWASSGNTFTPLEGLPGALSSGDGLLLVRAAQYTVGSGKDFSLPSVAESTCRGVNPDLEGQRTRLCLLLYDDVSEGLVTFAYSDGWRSADTTNPGGILAEGVVPTWDYDWTQATLAAVSAGGQQWFCTQNLGPDEDILAFVDQRASVRHLTFQYQGTENPDTAGAPSSALVKATNPAAIGRDCHIDWILCIGEAVDGTHTGQISQQQRGATVNGVGCRLSNIITHEFIGAQSASGGSGPEGSGVRCGANTPTLVAHITGWGNHRGWEGDINTGTVTVRNVQMFASTLIDFNFETAATFDISGARSTDGTADDQGGTNNVAGVDVDDYLESAAARDFRTLVSAINNGENLGAGSPARISINGVDRSAAGQWTIGAFEPLAPIDSEITVPASSAAALPGDVTGAASSAAALPSHVTGPASTAVALPSKVSVSISTAVALPSDVTATASSATALPSLVTVPASTAVVLSATAGEATATAASAVKQNADVAVSASSAAALPSIVTVPASTATALPGHTTAATASAAALPSQVTAGAASYVVGALTTSEVTVPASSSAALPSQATASASTAAALPSVVAVTFSSAVALPSLVTVLASSAAALPGNVSAGAATYASVATFAGEVTIPASSAAALPGVISGAAASYVILGELPTPDPSNVIYAARRLKVVYTQ